MYPPMQNSIVTAELRDIVESGVNIWEFDYPSYYKGEEKAAFEKKVLDHFWMRQIGAETVGRFLWYFRRTVREIMPLYIQRYKSCELMDDPEIRPLENYYMIEEGENSGTHSNTTTSESNDSSTESAVNSSGTASKNTEVHSDTPQGTLNISIPAYPLNENTPETIKHASDVQQTLGGQQTTGNLDTETSGTSSASATVTGQTGDNHRLTRRGNIGVTTYSQLLEGYRETFLNIDMEIIRELETCFLGVY